MTERPIIFSGPMVRAILEGRKTQTRRVLKHGWAPEDRIVSLPDGTNKGLRVVPYAVGDLLWVRESWRSEARFDKMPVPSVALVSYEADYNREPNDGCRGRLRPSIHMPRWASRITLAVTAVKVERLQDISGADTIAEGVQCSTCEAMKVSACHDSGCFASTQAFRELWTSIHGPDAWAANPWVAAITFERVKP